MHRSFIIFIYCWLLPIYVLSQVNFSQLEFRDYDLVHLKGDSVPFTGKCVGRCNLLDDSFKFGKGDFFYVLGEVMALDVKGRYRQGKPVGKWVFRTMDGKLRGVQRFKDGKLNGWFKSYYLNGNIELKQKKKNDKSNGMSYGYDRKGKMIYKAKYKDGEEIKVYRYTPSLINHEIG